MGAAREDGLDVTGFGMPGFGITGFGMPAFDMPAFDVAVSDAWQRFETNLAAYVAAMPTGTYITISSAQASRGQRGQRPYVDLVAVDAEQILGVASLPSYLYPDAPDADSADRRLHGLGWSEPGKPTPDGTVMDFVLDAAPDESDYLATVAVATFREVWNIPHPSFLTAWAVGQGVNNDGPVSLAHASTSTEHSTVPDPPIGLRSLHAWCDLVGATVDPSTVHSVCREDDFDDLRRHATAQGHYCAARSIQYSREGSRAAARVWRQQARSWNDTAESLRNAAAVNHNSSSRQNRPAESAGA